MAETQRTLVDASTLIALAQTGRLDLLREMFGTVYTTRVVQNGILAGEHPDSGALEAAFEQGWLAAVTLGRKKGHKKWEESGLGPGEASLFAVAKEGDLLILDDRNARRFAASRGHRITGLLALLVHAVHTDNLSPQDAKGTLRKLAHCDFRMSVDLYDWALARIEDAGERRPPDD